MTPHMREALELLARHSDTHVMDTLLNFCRIKGVKGELTERDAAECYDIVLAAYNKKHRRDTSPLGLVRLRAILRIKKAINSGS